MHIDKPRADVTALKVDYGIALATAARRYARDFIVLDEKVAAFFDLHILAAVEYLSVDKRVFHFYTPSERTQFSISASEARLSNFPGLKLAFGATFSSTATVLPMPLPPLVANGTIVLPAKS